MRKLILLSPALTFFSGLAGLAHAQAPPFVCTASVGVPLVARSEGLSELAGDLMLTCTGGTPTPAGQIIQAVNLTLTLNANLTSKLTSAGQPQFSEALLVVDEPGSGVNPTRPILNCGNKGAPDISAYGPGACTPIGTGNPALSYDGMPNGYGTATCDGLTGRPAPNSSSVCGRPNVFQGQLLNPSLPNQVLFQSVPLDPPGTTTTRTMRFTNLRINATSVSRAAPSTQSTVQVTVSADNSISIAIEDPQQVIAYIEPGLNPNPSPCSGAGPLVCIQEGFASSWRPKNISFAVGNLISGNASFSPSNPEFYWAYNGGQNYPPDVAQNVPGAVYNSESGFEWENNSPNGPPSPNPPQGIGAVTVEQGLAGPLYSQGFVFPSTGISAAGVANSGTRIRVQFTGLQAGASIQIPTVVTLSNSTTASSGVMVLTNSDSAGAGQFSPNNAATVTLVNNSGTAFAYYEVLWADPFSIETAAVPYTLLNAPPGTSIQSSAAFAPFYSDSASAQPSATAPLPRFLDSTLLCAEQSCLNVSPNQGVNSGPIQLSITSYGNQPLAGAQVVLRSAGLPDIVGTNATNSTPGTLVATFDLTAVSPGVRDVVLTPAGQNPITLPAGFLVVAAPPVPVPNVLNQTQSVATAAIAGAGLVVGTVTQQSSPTVPAGSVISQSPAPAVLVNLGSAVNLVISTGPTIAVPNVVGQTQAAATAAITSAGLIAGSVAPESSSTVPAGDVIRELPGAGTVVSSGSVVIIVISSGVAMVAVPNVVGATNTNAAVAISNSGLIEQSASEVYVDYGVYSGPKNLVLQGVPGTTQNLIINLAGDPASWDTLQLSVTSTGAASSASNPLGAAAGVALAGSSTNAPAALAFNFGDSIPGNAVWVGSTLWGNGITGGFSDGDSYATFLTGAQQGGPYYEGWIHFKIQNSALPTATLTVVDWAYTIYPVPFTMGEIFVTGVPAGNVISQSPAAGTVVPVGSGVNITVSEGPLPVVVPVATGQTQAAARIIIMNQGLVIGTVTQQPSTTAPSGSVISESPVAGTSLNVGSAVNLVISTGPPTVAVPNIVGTTQAAASTAITGAGLVVGTVTQQASSTVTSGSVISQSPTPATQVNPGSAVNIVVSTGPGQVAVPNVVGLTQAAATAAIANAGLVVASAQQAYTNLGYYSGPQNLVLQGVPGTTQNLIVNIAGFPAGWDCLQLTISSTGTASVGSNPISSAAGFALAGNVPNYSQALSLNLGDPYPANPAYVNNPVFLWGNGTPGVFTDGEQYAAMLSGTESDGPYYVGWIHFKLQNSALPTATLTVIDWAYDIGSYSLSMGQIPVRDVPAGNIISESPAAGTVVAAGSGVNLNVSEGPLPVTLPNVLSQTQTAGTSEIITVGLLIGTVTQQSSTTVPSGSIISQSPAANTSVVIDSSVNLVISTGPAQVSVPNVVGSTQAAAAGAITGAGLVVGTVTQQSSSTVPSGSVISESPVATTLVTVGSAVNLVVSSGPAQSGPPPAFVQVNQNEISSGSSVAVRLNAATKAGNTIVVYAIWDNAGSASVKDTRADNFVSVSPPVTWGNGYSAQIFYATNIVGGTDTVTVAFKQPASIFGVVYAHEYSGINTSNPIDVIASASGSSATLNSGAAITTSANDLIFGAGVSDNNVAAAGSGFTARDLNYGNITEDRTAVSVGSYSATATHNGQQWGMQVVAFRAAGSAGSGGGVAASPTFNPPAGSYPSAQSVKLSTATPGASIYYTTDGSAPSTLSTLYTVPISVNSSLTIKAIAHEAGMTDSLMVSAAYQIGAAGTPPAFVQVNDNDISAGSSVPVSFNAPVKAGNTIVVYAIWDNAGPASITDTQGNHFVSVSAPVNWGNGYRAEVFYATNIAAGADTVKATFATPATIFGVIYAHEYSGISATYPVDVIASASGSSATLNSGVATTTSANDLIFAAGVSDNIVMNAGTGFTARDLNYGNITEDKTAASIGSYSATATHNGNQWGMQMVAFRPAQ